MTEKGLVDTVPIEVLHAYERQAQDIAALFSPSGGPAARNAVLKAMLQAREAGVTATALGIVVAADQLNQELVEALQVARNWLDGWASAESEIAFIDAVLAKAVRR